VDLLDRNQNAEKTCFKLHHLNDVDIWLLNMPKSDGFHFLLLPGFRDNQVTIIGFSADIGYTLGDSHEDCK
jgi:hypothetical protein